MPPREQSQGGIGLRRNGKEKACEPCRKGKLACDHSLPVCGRCVRRKITAKCLYHPAPMTRPRDSDPVISSPQATFQQHTPTNSTGRSSHILSPQRGAKGSNIHPNLGQYTVDTGVPMQSPQTNTPGSSGAPQRIVKDSPSYDWDHDAVFKRSARYYGPTSFSAVFNEGTKLSEDLDISDDRRKHPSNWPFGSPLLGRERPSAPTVRMNHVVRALQNLPSREICGKLLGTFNSFHHYLMSPVMIGHCIETLFSTFRNELSEPRTPEKLAVIADVMFKNEEKPLPSAPQEGMDWLDGFMGPNLRFEMLGMLFCFFGMSYQTLQDWDELFKVPDNHGRDRKQTSWRMKECSDVCLKMCEISEENNEISIALMHTQSILESVCTGDESFQLRRRHGEIIVCTIAAGLHRLPAVHPSKLTAALEYKIRLFSVIYASDKDHSSLNGTPPALSARFCTLRMPLDLSEEDLYLPQVELANVISRLDPSGWDLSGQMHRATFHRTLHLFSGIREEILDVSLGVDALLSEERIEDLYRRCQETYDNLPEKVRYYAYDTMPKSGSEGRVLVSQAYLMLNLLQNRFLIDRVAITRGFPKGQRLLNTALEMMDLTNMFWIKRDQLMIYASAFDWIFTCYGIPAAGVLCVELLKQATGQNVLQFSRSDAIQKLTMFIGFLEWIRPTDGNFLLAGRLKKVVRRILDRVLDPPAQIPMDNDMMPIDPMLAPFGEMDWLNTIDWTQGSSWMEFN